MIDFRQSRPADRSEEEVEVDDDEKKKQRKDNERTALVTRPDSVERKTTSGSLQQVRRAGQVIGRQVSSNRSTDIPFGFFWLLLLLLLLFSAKSSPATLSCLTSWETMTGLGGPAGRIWNLVACQTTTKKQTNKRLIKNASANVFFCRGLGLRRSPHHSSPRGYGVAGTRTASPA